MLPLGLSYAEQTQHSGSWRRVPVQSQFFLRYVEIRISVALVPMCLSSHPPLPEDPPLQLCLLSWLLLPFVCTNPLLTMS